MEEATIAAPPRRPVGRPPRISRAQIVAAANELGLEGLTLRAVAEHLGVSIAALYHHFASKEELIRLAAEASATKLPLPEDTDQHWAVWLLEWARYNRDAFLAEPALLEHYVDGALTPESVVGNLDRILGLLLRQGFTPAEALTAYDAVSAFAIGTAVATLRQRALGSAGLWTSADPSSAALDAYPSVRAVVAHVERHQVPSFEDRLVLILTGIAEARGVAPDELRRALRRVLDRERRRARRG